MRNLLVRGGVALALIAASLVAGSPASAGSIFDSPNDKVAIELVAMAGSGCRPGSADVAISPDYTAFTAIYSDYSLEHTASTSGLLRKNCQLNVLVKVPQGFTFAITKADYRGFGSLAAGVTATQHAHYYFQGMTETTSVRHAISAPRDDMWIASDEVPIAAVVWRPCGELRNLNINTELRLSKGSSKTESLLTMDSIDGSIKTTYHMAWRQCR